MKEPLDQTMCMAKVNSSGLQKRLRVSWIGSRMQLLNTALQNCFYERRWISSSRHNMDSNVSLSWMWVQSKSFPVLFYLIHDVPRAGRSEGSGVDRCFPGWNHGRWIFGCDYTSCGRSGGNWTRCKWFLLWRKIKLLGVSLYLLTMCLFTTTNRAHDINWN